MNKIITTLLLFTVFNIGIHAQNSFEQGYFIKNDGSKVECLIKNQDWANNPSKFSYKLNTNSDAQEAQIENIKEFIHALLKFSDSYVL